MGRHTIVAAHRPRLGIGYRILRQPEAETLLETLANPGRHPIRHSFQRRGTRRGHKGVRLLATAMTIGHPETRPRTCPEILSVSGHSSVPQRHPDLSPRQHTFAFAFADGLVADGHNIENATGYGRAYCEGWIPGDSVRKRVYRAGINDGLDDAEGRNEPEGLNPNNSDNAIARVDRCISAIYRTGLQNGSNARTGNFPIMH